MSLFADQRQEQEYVGRHHLHGIAQPGSVVQHRFERDGIPGKVGQPGKGFTALSPDALPGYFIIVSMGMQGNPSDVLWRVAGGRTTPGSRALPFLTGVKKIV
jgi:hypothetical protein